MTHEELRELIPGYALDALSPKATQAVDAHLPTCEQCQKELARLRDVTAELAIGVARVEPPAGLRDRIIGVVRPHRRGFAGQPGWALALAAAAVLIVVLGVLDLALQRRLVALNRQVADQTQLLALLANPSVRTVTLTGSMPGTARFVFDPAARRGAMVVAGLRDPGREFVYQVWLVAGKRPDSAGVFRPEPGRPVIVTVRADFTQYQAIAISIERAPAGAPSPTTTPILVGTLSGTT